MDIVHPRELHLIDPYRYEPGKEYRLSLYGGLMGGGQDRLDARYEAVKKRFHKHIESGTVIVHRVPSTEAAGKFPAKYFDWIYIDGNHLYPFVKADLEGYAPKLKSGGVIAGDDYGITGWWHNGVKKAVDEFAAQYSSNPVVARNGQFILKIA